MVGWQTGWPAGIATRTEQNRTEGRTVCTVIKFSLVDRRHTTTHGGLGPGRSITAALLLFSLLSSSLLCTDFQKKKKNNNNNNNN